MQCIERDAQVECMDTAQLPAGCGLTLHEYALWHQLPPDLPVRHEQTHGLILILNGNYPLDYRPGLPGELPC